VRVTNRRLAPRNVASIVKAGALKLGFDPATFGGHSLRAGFVTRPTAAAPKHSSVTPARDCSE